VDLHGLPTFEPRTGLPSRTGTTALLDKDVLEIILSTQQAEQGWIDNLRMFRRVNSIWIVQHSPYAPILPTISPGNKPLRKKSLGDQPSTAKDKGPGTG